MDRFSGIIDLLNGLERELDAASWPSFVASAPARDSSPNERRRWIGHAQAWLDREIVPRVDKVQAIITHARALLADLDRGAASSAV